MVCYYQVSSFETTVFWLACFCWLWAMQFTLSFQKSMVVISKRQILLDLFWKFLAFNKPIGFIMSVHATSTQRHNKVMSLLLGSRTSPALDRSQNHHNHQHTPPSFSFEKTKTTYNRHSHPWASSLPPDSPQQQPYYQQYPIMSAEEVAKSFVDHYYNLRANNPGGIASLYAETSTLTFEGEQFKGTQAISGKLGMAAAQFQVKSMDVQPSINEQSICIFVTGGLQIEVRSYCKWDRSVDREDRGTHVQHSRTYTHNPIFVPLMNFLPYTCSYYMTAWKVSSLLRILPTCSYRSVSYI